MTIAKNILLFTIKLPFRLLAIPVVMLLMGLEGLASAGKLIGGIALFLYNLLLLFSLCVIIHDQTWNKLWQAGILVLFEGAVLGGAGFVFAIMKLTSDALLRFVISGKFAFVE